MLLNVTFYSKVIDYEGERDGLKYMSVEAWGEVSLNVSIFGDSLFEHFVCQNARLWERIHTFFYLHVYITIVFKEHVGSLISAGMSDVLNFVYPKWSGGVSK